MSQRYRRERARNGMICDPIALNVNNNEFAEEFDGYMDRENIPADALAEAAIVAGTFTALYTQVKATTVAMDATSQEWQRQDTGGVEVNSLSQTLTANSVVHIDWSGALEWAGVFDGDCVRVRLTVNGVAIAESGFLDSRRQYQGVALSGTLPLQAGPLDVRVEGMIANVEQDIESPGVFGILGPVTNTVSFSHRELVAEVRSR